MKSIVIGAALLIAAGSAGCTAPNYLGRLGFEPRAEPPTRGAPVNAALRVNTFEDQRAQHEPVIVFTSAANPINLDGLELCVNIEKGYAGQVAADLSSVINRTAARRGVFKASDSGAPTYLLDGTLVELLGRKQFGEQANISIHFGDLKLTDTRTGDTRRLPGVTVDTPDVYSPPDSSADCSTIFDQVNSQLEEAVGTLLMSAEWTVLWWTVEAKPDEMGELPPEMIQRVVRENYGKFKRCHEAGLSQDPSLRGRVTTGFIISEDGTVDLVEDAGSDIPDRKVAACVREQFKTVSFPMPKGGKVSVVYPIRFSP